MPAARPARRWLAGLWLAALAMAWCAGCAGRSTPPGIGVQPTNPVVSSPVISSPVVSNPVASSTAPGVGVVPRPRRTVVVIFENHAYSQIIGSPQAPYINALAHQGALFTSSYAVTHPSEPNYLALLSGSTQGVTGDQCPTTLRTPNLAADLIGAGLGFAGYAEGLPAAGSLACESGDYARKHVPWADFSNVPRSVSQPFTKFPLAGYSRLPAVSFVIPNLCHDMHDCPVSTGDAWLRDHLRSYTSWAMTHDSLLIVTWDEDDSGHSNHIATIFVGQQVRPGRYGKPIDHYNVLRTLEQAYGLPHRSQAARHYPITWVWR
jgi:phosphatidylinositol-3-phosphatase